jgi:hypothetical protein
VDPVTFISTTLAEFWAQGIPRADYERAVRVVLRLSGRPVAPVSSPVEAPQPVIPSAAKAAPTPPKRKPGRPPKAKAAKAAPQPGKRGPGRPPKSPEGSLKDRLASLLMSRGSMSSKELAEETGTQAMTSLYGALKPIATRDDDTGLWSLIAQPQETDEAPAASRELALPEELFDGGGAI